MSVVPCRFFGTPNGCRYGDNCKFYHAIGNNLGAFGGRSFNTGGLGQNQQDVLNLAAKSQQNMDAMIDMVKRDMVEWEQGHIYPFSCYGPSAGKPSLPGFEEICPDELRYRFYMLNNKLPLDLSREISTMQQARMQYQQISPAVRNILERVIVRGERISSTDMGASSTQNPFGGGLIVANPFASNAMTQPASNVFGQPSSGASLFGGGGSIGGQTSGMFGAAPIAQTSNIFGGNSTTNIPPSSNIFGSPQPIVSSGQTASLFGNQISSLFGGTVQPQVPSASSLFGGAVSNPVVGQQQSVFGGSTTNGGGLFGTITPVSTAGTSPFGVASTQVFGTTSQSSNLFSQTPPSVTQSSGLFSSVPKSNVFGNQNLGAPGQNSIFGQPPSQTQFQSPTLQGLLTGQPPPNPQQNILFGNVTSQPFVQPQQQSGLPSSGSFFSSSSTPQIGFGGGQASLVQPTQPSSLFGTPSTPNVQPGFTLGNQPSILGTPPPSISALPNTTLCNKFVYTDEADLTEEELAAFRAPNFTLDNIPTRPPPLSLCGV